MATTPNDINKKVEEDTSFGTYVAKDLKTTAMMLGGVAVGIGAGYAASKSGGIVNALRSATKWVGSWFKGDTAKAITHFAETSNAGVILPAVGAVAGTFAAAIPNTYEHWAEGKKAQLRVEEMTDDVVALREQRNAAMTSLREQAEAIKSQNNAIKDILAKGPKSPEALAANPLPEEQVTRLEQRGQQASVPQRG